MAGRDERQHEFFVDLPEGGDALRVRFDVDRGQVTAFTVQYEIWRDERWLPVVRYDSAHQQPHRDTLDRSGKVVAKDWLPAGISLNVAMQQAIRDLKSNWRAYLAAFERDLS